MSPTGNSKTRGVQPMKLRDLQDLSELLRMYVARHVLDDGVKRDAQRLHNHIKRAINQAHRREQKLALAEQLKL